MIYTRALSRASHSHFIRTASDMEFAKQWTKYHLLDAPDPRTIHLPLVANPLHISIICCVWLYGIFRVGPRYIANRKPMQLTRLMQVINVFQVLINSFIVYELLDAAWLNDYKLRCQEYNADVTKDSMRVVRAVYIYFLTKLFDLSDTIIFVLRGKTNQVTFLHVYHHVATLFLAWIGTHYSPSGFVAIVPLTNCFIHVTMYTYYFLASLGPQYQKYLWWKKYLTRLQLIQFVYQMTASMDHLINCKPDKQTPLLLVGIPVVASYFVLFMKFYSKAYASKKSKSH